MNNKLYLIARLLVNTGCRPVHVNIVQGIVLLFSIITLTCFFYAYFFIKNNYLAALLFVSFVFDVIFVIFLSFLRKQVRILFSMNKVNRNAYKSILLRNIAGCSAIFFIFYLLFQSIMDVTGVQFKEFSFLYSLVFISGYILVCIVFFPLCNKYMK